MSLSKTVVVPFGAVSSYINPPVTLGALMFVIAVSVARQATKCIPRDTSIANNITNPINAWPPASGSLRIAARLTVCGVTATKATAMTAGQPNAAPEPLTPRAIKHNLSSGQTVIQRTHPVLPRLEEKRTVTSYSELRWRLAAEVQDWSRQVDRYDNQSAIRIGRTWLESEIDLTRGVTNSLRNIASLTMSALSRA
jgi:hypothetical protein